MPHNREPCCAPTRVRLGQLARSIQDSYTRIRATDGSAENMIKLDGGSFLMGSEFPMPFPADGEGPVRRVTLDAFQISKYAVTNEQFREFIDRTNYRTDAELFGWSFAFANHIPTSMRGVAPAGTPWWVRVDGADWAHPEGPGSSITNRLNYPVVHVSWNDAIEFCKWAGYRLPSEAEWEYAARAGLEQQIYPWGNELLPGGIHMCNIWQGNFPQCDLGEDGFTNVAPVDSFPPNAYGLHNMVGNVWEWCADYFDPAWHVDATRLNPVGPPNGTTRVMKGGSYLCHESYCWRYRTAARTGTPPDSSTTHIGFRVVGDI